MDRKFRLGADARDVGKDDEDDVGGAVRVIARL